MAEPGVARRKQAERPFETEPLAICTTFLANKRPYQIEDEDDDEDEYDQEAPL